jgi:hypothetical protein
MMNSMKNLLIIFLWYMPVFAVTIGSDTAVNRFYTQQILGTGDRVASFAALYGGVGLTSLTTTATWDSVFALGGPLSLNNGTMLLNTDLLLDNNSIFFSVGSITGQNHQLSLAPTNSLIHTSTATSQRCIISNLNIFLNTDALMRNCFITFTGTNIINGQGAALTLLPTATLILGTNATLQFRNITINGMTPRTLYASTNTSTFMFNNTTINLSSNYTFTIGRFEVYNEVMITGSGFGINYSSTGASFVASAAQLLLDQGVTFSYVPTNASQNLFTFADSTAQLYLRGGIFYTGSGGINFLKGTIMVDKQSYFLNAGATAAAGIILGDGANAVNNAVLDLLPAAVLNVSQGFLVDKNV